MKTRQSQQRVCRRLRNKGMFIDAEPDPSIPSMRDGLFWCSRTWNNLGPDGKAVEEERCCEGRSCFELTS